jgi:carbon monoxide dehydrogenase subunit G
MRFDQHFEVEGSPRQVIVLFEDVRLMASFLPGASVGERLEDGSHPAELAVAFGPKRIVFRGRLTPSIDRDGLKGTVVGHASTDLRGAKMSVTMHYALTPAAAGTRVDLVSEAELTGMLAEFARTGGVVVTEALLAQFAQRLSAHVRSLPGTAPAASGPAPGVAPGAPAAPQAAAALSGLALLRQVLEAVLRRLWPGRRG